MNGPPCRKISSEDAIARRIRRDAWMVWWRNTDGDALLAVVKEFTLTPELRQKVKELIDKLGNDSFSVREAADAELHRLGRIALPQLRQAKSSQDLERASCARRLVERIEREPMRNLPTAAARR